MGKRKRKITINIDAQGRSDASGEKGRPLYRSRKGWIFGVCSGLAEYAQLNVFWIRAFAVLALMMSGFFPVVFCYLIMAMFMKPAPSSNLEADDMEFYNSFAADRGLAADRLRRKFDQIERRTRRLEAIVTDKAYDWDRRFGTQ